MAIKIRGQDLQARYINGRSVVKVMRWSVEVRPNSWYPMESIVYKMKAWASGNLYAPVSYRRTSSPYNWKISIDWGAETIYSWTATIWGDLTIWTWYTPDTVHTIMIKPVVETYWRAKAFCFYNVGIANLLTEVVQDQSYMWFAESDTLTWPEFRWYQYSWCTSLQSAPKEFLPNSVINIGDSFREHQYEDCTSLITTPNEVLPNSVIEIEDDFRFFQYSWCTSLTTAWAEAMSNSIVNIWNYARYFQYAWASLLTTANLIAMNNVGLYYRYGQFTYSYYPLPISRPLIVTISGNVVDSAPDSASLDTINCAEIRVPSSLLSAYQNASNWSSVASLFVWY